MSFKNGVGYRDFSAIKMQATLDCCAYKVTLKARAFYQG
jgi:hypothetical protein